MQAIENQTNIEEVMYEIEFLEKKIFRIGQLLTFAYGYDGIETITRFRQDNNYNLIKKGDKIIGIFAICEITNFGDLVRILDEDIIIFTNKLS